MRRRYSSYPVPAVIYVHKRAFELFLDSKFPTAPTALHDVRRRLFPPNPNRGTWGVIRRDMPHENQSR